MNKISEIRIKQRSELLSELMRFRKEAMNLRFQSKLSADFRNTSRIRAVRKQIARITMVLREKSLLA